MDFFDVFAECSGRFKYTLLFQAMCTRKWCGNKQSQHKATPRVREKDTTDLRTLIPQVTRARNRQQHDALMGGADPMMHTLRTTRALRLTRRWLI